MCRDLVSPVGGYIITREHGNSWHQVRSRSIYKKFREGKRSLNQSWSCFSRSVSLNGSTYLDQLFRLPSTHHWHTWWVPWNTGPKASGAKPRGGTEKPSAQEGKNISHRNSIHSFYIENNYLLIPIRFACFIGLRTAAWSESFEACAVGARVQTSQTAGGSHEWSLLYHCLMLFLSKAFKVDGFAVCRACTSAMELISEISTSCHPLTQVLI